MHTHGISRKVSSTLSLTRFPASPFTCVQEPNNPPRQPQFPLHAKPPHRQASPRSGNSTSSSPGPRVWDVASRSDRAKSRDNSGSGARDGGSRSRREERTSRSPSPPFVPSGASAESSHHRNKRSASRSPSPAFVPGNAAAAVLHHDSSGNGYGGEERDKERDEEERSVRRRRRGPQDDDDEDEDDRRR